MMRLSSTNPHWHPRGLAFAVAGVLFVPGLGAQQQAPPPVAVQVGLPTLQTSVPTRQILMKVGESTVIDTDFDVTSVVITDDVVAHLEPVTERQLAIQAKDVGSVGLILWGDGRREHYAIVVDPGVSQLELALDTLFPGEDLSVTVNEGAVILSGNVSNNEAMLRIGEIAAASAPEAKIINMLQLPGGNGSQQVMLQVRIAEVNRRAVEELGISLFTSRSGFTSRATTQQFSAPDFDDTGASGDAGAASGLVFADYLNLFFFQRNEGIGGVLRALDQNGWFESLAEPNLIAYNGEEASFLAGGEFPIPFVAAASGQVSIIFKEYGVRLKFTPTIAGDIIRLSVDPEVSTLDFANGVSLGGFRVPALITRRAHTVVELRDGQSFAIAGLLDTINQSDRAAIPFLSRIPIIGNLFKSKAQRENQTELMVLVTPRLVRALNPDEVPPLPTIIRAPAGGGAGDLGGQLLGGGGLADAPPAQRRGGGR